MNTSLPPTNLTLHAHRNPFIGGALFPLLINYLLTHTGGFRWTLRIMAILIAVCGGIAFLGVRPRVPIAPVSRVRGSRRAQAGGIALDLSFFKSPLFILVVSLLVFWREEYR